MPCAGLMEFIEAGDLDSNELKFYLKEKFNKYENKDIICCNVPFDHHVLL